MVTIIPERANAKKDGGKRDQIKGFLGNIQEENYKSD
jgi:hypothetical protein